ncbi:hypothetical protein [Parasitella parasitica]|uniref:Uncharacterized protein n=1 Tax=Parasitella parasitica TaxID=35722 RepID=A0A0B7NB33_9FUNG|nr:hypothetical protein [Parasitella parasitica]
MSLMTSTNIWPGSTALIQWHNGARNVNVMLAVQDKDGTLSPVGQTTFNVAPYGSTVIRINSDTPTGRNYFFVAEDMIDPSNYTSVGPFAIFDPFGDAHPTNSIAATATERFLTDSPATASSNMPTGTTSVRSKSTNTVTNDSSDGNEESPTHFILGVVQIVGIVIGCVAAVVLGAITYVCVFKKRTKFTPDTPLFPPAPMNMTNGSHPMLGVPPPTIPPTRKKQSIKKPAVSPVSPATTVQENTTINMSADLSYTHNMSNHSPQGVMAPQQAYTHYGNNGMYYGNQIQYPSQDTMPIPTHFSESTSPPSFTYTQQQRQLYPPSPQIQAADTADYWNYLPPTFTSSPKPDVNELDNKTEQNPMTSAVAPKTELKAVSKTEQAESTLAERFEIPVVEAQLEQQNDTTNLLQKPNTHCW